MVVRYAIIMNIIISNLTILAWRTRWSIQSWLTYMNNHDSYFWMTDWQVVMILPFGPGRPGIPGSPVTEKRQICRVIVDKSSKLYYLFVPRVHSNLRVLEDLVSLPDLVHLELILSSDSYMMTSSLKKSNLPGKPVLPFNPGKPDENEINLYSRFVYMTLKRMMIPGIPFIPRSPFWPGIPAPPSRPGKPDSPLAPGSPLKQIQRHNKSVCYIDLLYFYTIQSWGSVQACKRNYSKLRKTNFIENYNHLPDKPGSPFKPGSPLNPVSPRNRDTLLPMMLFQEKNLPFCPATPGRPGAPRNETNCKILRC